MEEESSLKRTLSLGSIDSDLEDENISNKCSVKKAKILKEFPLNRQGSSTESQYVVMSQTNDVVDQSTLEYSLEDFLSEDDVDEDEVNDEAECPKLSDTEEYSNKTDEIDWDEEIKGDTSDIKSTFENVLNDLPSKSGADETFQYNQNNNTDSTNNSEIDEQMPGLVKIESVYKDANLIKTVVSEQNFKKIYDKLAEKRSNPNRLDIVTAELLEEHDLTTSDAIFKDVQNVIKQVQTKSSERLNEHYILSLLRLNEKKKNRVDIVIQQLLVSLQEADVNDNNAEISTFKVADIFDQVNTVLAKFPKMSPDEIYTLLESQPPSSDRIQKVFEILGYKTPAVDHKKQLERLESDPDNPLTKNDPIYQDMRVVAKMFPDKDRNEIYALLEAHHNKLDRIQVVIEELLKFSSDSQDVVDNTTTTAFNNINYPLTNRSHGEFENLCEIFPDCDPNYIFEQLELNANDTDRMNKLAARMFEQKNYPKLTELLEKQKTDLNKRRIQNMDLHMVDFLRKFPDPVVFFENNDKVMSVGYKEHVLIQIKNDYPQLKDGYVKDVLERNNHYLFKSLREVNEEINRIAASVGRHSKKLRAVNRRIEIPFPEVPDEFFFNELLYSKHELEIKMHLKKLEDDKKQRIENAKRNGELYECGCCFDDEVLFEDMATCADGHLFCKECVRRSTEAAIGQAKLKFPCLTGTCEHDIPLSVLQTNVTPSLFSNILRKLQEEELRLADIPDLVSCPFCSFATVMPDPNDKVFKCLNPECLKETCRFCQEANHVPLKCNEVEKKTETDMRTYIENKISEAMLRTCSHCKKRFFKDFGCNKMTCTCGATMCYVCREPDIDYDHFNTNGGCANDNDVNALHQKEMETAAEVARKQYLEEHPDAANLELKYDPQKLVDEMRNEKHPGPDSENYDDEEEDYEDDYY